MSFTVHTLFFAVYSVLAAALALATLAVTVLHFRTIPRRTLWAVCLATTFVIPVFAGTAAGAEPSLGFLLLLSPLLPLFCIGAMIGGVHGLGERCLGERVLVVSTTLWNLALMVVYGLRAAQVCFHVDLDVVGGGLLSAFAISQRNVGLPGAEQAPVFLYLPIFLPPACYFGRVASGVTGAGAFLATFMICLFAAACPEGFRLTQLNRRDTTSATIPARRDLAVAMQVGDGNFAEPRQIPSGLASLGRTADWATCVERAKELGLAALELPVSADVVKRPDPFRRLNALVEQIRAAGLRVHLVVLAPRPDGMPLHRSTFQERMQEAHWILSERLKPDLLVLFSRPFGERTVAAVGDLPVSHWTTLIEESVRAVKEGHPRQLTAIDLEAPLPRARALFAELGGSVKGLDTVRFVVESSRLDRVTVSRGLIQLAGWLAAHPTHKSLALVGAPPAPIALGGTLAQSIFHRRVLRFAAQQPLITSVSLGPMIDAPDAWNGLWDNRDMARPALPLVHELLRQIHGSEPPATPR